MASSLYKILSPRRRKGPFQAVWFHAHTLWLFTVNDLKTIVIPSTIFALLTCAYMDTHYAAAIQRTPRVLLWTWVNLLAITVSNQRSPSAIMEDRLNKPWRPMPTGRLSPTQASTLGIFAHLLAQLASLVLGGGLAQSGSLILLGYLYNDLGGGDRSFITRNLINAAGFASFTSGALEVACGGESVFASTRTMAWLGVNAAVISTTIHSQDMYDQVGDSAAGRRTAPLVLGDGISRLTIALAVLFWSIACPWFCGSGPTGLSILFPLGAFVAWRTLRRTSVSEDRSTYKLYNMWLVGVYSLPLIAHLRTGSLLGSIGV